MRYVCVSCCLLCLSRVALCCDGSLFVDVNLLLSVVVACDCCSVVACVCA